MRGTGRIIGGTLLAGFLLASGCEQGQAGGVGTQGKQGSQGPEGPQGPATDGTAGMAGTMGGQGAQGKDPLPANIQLDHVNLTSFMATIPGLHLISRGGSMNNIAGAFDYDATGCASGMADKGNMLWVGFPKPGGNTNLALANLASLSLHGRMERGTSSLRFVMIVDCNGDNAYDTATDAVVVTDPSKTMLTTTMAAYQVNASDMAFATVGGAKCGLPDAGTNTYDQLSKITGTAKLIAAQPKVCGMPNGATMSPLMLVQGDKDDLMFRHALIQDLTVTTGAADVYTFNR